MRLHSVAPPPSPQHPPPRPDRVAGARFMASGGGQAPAPPAVGARLGLAPGDPAGALLLQQWAQAQAAEDGPPAATAAARYGAAARLVRLPTLRPVVEIVDLPAPQPSGRVIELSA